MVVVVVVLPGLNLSAKLVSITQGGLFEEPGAAGVGAGAAAGSRGWGGTAAGLGPGAEETQQEASVNINIAKDHLLRVTNFN